MTDKAISEATGGESFETQTVTEKYSPAFFALAASRVTESIIADGAAVARTLGIDIPARSMSTMLSLYDAPKGVTKLARELSVTHVAIIKISKTLIDRGYVQAGRDPLDARRRPLELTEKGRVAAREVQWFMTALKATYAELFAEVGVDAESVMLSLEKALMQRSFHDRLNAASQGQHGR